MVTALLAEGADPTWQSKAGETPLHVAVRYCHWEVADELLRFIAKSKSTLDAIILVNIQNGVSNLRIQTSNILRVHLRIPSKVYHGVNGETVTASERVNRP